MSKKLLVLFLALLIILLMVPACVGAGSSNDSGSISESDESVCDHEIVIDEAISPTCTELGLSEGKHCSICGKIIVEQQILPQVDEPYTIVYSGGDIKRIDFNPMYSVSSIDIPLLTPEGDYVPGQLLVTEQIPVIMLIEDFELLIERLETFFGKDDFRVKKFKAYYMVYDLNNMQSELFKRVLAERVPIVTLHPVAYLDSTSSPRERKTLMAILEASSIDWEQITRTSFNFLLDYINGRDLSEQEKIRIIRTLPMRTSFPSSLLSVTYNGKFVYNVDEYADVPTSLKKEIIDIPEGVKGIGRYAFSNNPYLTTITIPSSVQNIDTYAFEGCKALITINYAGTIEQWENISKSSLWDTKTGTYTIHCSDGDITKS